jgi:hypothetical protein
MCVSSRRRLPRAWVIRFPSHPRSFESFALRVWRCRGSPSTLCRCLEHEVPLVPRVEIHGVELYGALVVEGPSSDHPVCENPRSVGVRALVETHCALRLKVTGKQPARTPTVPDYPAAGDRQAVFLRVSFADQCSLTAGQVHRTERVRRVVIPGDHRRRYGPSPERPGPSPGCLGHHGPGALQLRHDFCDEPPYAAPPAWA